MASAAREHTLLSTEIVNRGVESTGPDAGSPTFSVRVRRRLPDFLQSVNLKYVKLGYHYLISHGIYLATIPVLVLVFGAEVGSLRKEEIWLKLWEDSSYDLASLLAFLGVLVFTVSVYFMSRPRPIYLVDFACYKPSDDLKVSKEEFIEQARKSGKFDEDSLAFQRRILASSGIGDETYVPKAIFAPGPSATMKEGRAPRNQENKKSRERGRKRTELGSKLKAMALRTNFQPKIALPFTNPKKNPRSPTVSMTSTVGSSNKVDALKKPFSPPREVHVQVTHSMPPQKIEIFKSLEDWAEKNILILLKPVETNWQPQDFLPDSSSEGFYDEVKELRERAKEIPDDYFVCLVGDMITEEALPTYQTMLNTLDGVRDETGASLSSWAVWTRAWTAEENRHGDLLNKYLYLTGRVDMRQIEKTIQYLIGSGMDPRTENNPYLGFIYTSFQERATFISHGNTANHARQYGDLKLAQVCGTIAADEKRHEIAYTKIAEKLFEIDPDDTMLAFADMMRKKIAMPAHLMYDGHDDNLFEHFSAVAQRLGVYTAKDYANILEHLVGRWNLENVTGLSGEGARAQDFVCTLAPRIRRLEERAESRRTKQAEPMPFSWIFDRKVQL